MFVVDIGCLEQGDEESVRKLIERFRPDVLFGFDPHPALEDSVETIDGVLVERKRRAAWTEDGTVKIRPMGACTALAGEGSDVVRPYEQLEEVECFDLCDFLERLGGPTVLKLDCEGSEYPLLRAVHGRGLDRSVLQLVLVEWHDGVYAHGLGGKRPTLDCPVEEWERPARPSVGPIGPTTNVMRTYGDA